MAEKIAYRNDGVGSSHGRNHHRNSYGGDHAAHEPHEATRMEDHHRDSSRAIMELEYTDITRRILTVLAPCPIRERCSIESRRHIISAVKAWRISAGTDRGRLVARSTQTCTK